MPWSKPPNRKRGRIVETSRQLAYQRTQEADDYAMNVLKQLGQRLDVISQQVGNGIKMLGNA
ncbi:MAG: hypothetical protein R2838_13130 [Caldilineaceae bacterium]